VKDGNNQNPKVVQPGYDADYYKMIIEHTGDKVQSTRRSRTLINYNPIKTEAVSTGTASFYLPTLLRQYEVFIFYFGIIKHVILQFGNNGEIRLLQIIRKINYLTTLWKLFQKTERTVNGIH